MRIWFVANIRNNGTGEIRNYDTYDDIEDGEILPSTYIWEDGNYACDCNRGLFFGYSIGEKYKDIDHECGDEKFAVNLTLHDGTVFYREYE